MSITVRFNNRLAIASRLILMNADSTVSAMSNTILNDAIVKAPYASGNLSRSGRVDKHEFGKYTVAFGGTSNNVPYGVRRHFENKKNPQTRFYLSDPAQDVARNGIGRFIRK